MKKIVKSKSMLTEEIGLNGRLEAAGFKVVETDLGEWIVQLAGERPSHFTQPAVHKTREQVLEGWSRWLLSGESETCGMPKAADMEEARRRAVEGMARNPAWQE